jgi:hypothetical protein
MGEDFELNLNEGTADQIERNVQNNGLVPTGKYHASLEKVEDLISSTGKKGKELSFKILAGPDAGQIVKEKLYQSDSPTGQNRLKLFMHRLGCLQVATTGKYEYVEGRASLHDCISAEVVIDVIHEAWKNQQTGREGKTAKLAFCGVFPVNSKEAKGVILCKGERPAARESKPKEATFDPNEFGGGAADSATDGVDI